MKTGKKTLAMLLAAMLSVAALASCSGGSTDSGSGNSDGGTTTSSEPLSFKVTTVGFGDSPEGKLIQEEWLKLSGELLGREIQPEYEFINVGDYAEKLDIICAGGDIPDLLSYGWGTQADLIRYGEDGLFEEITQHLDSLPNYKAVLEADERAQYNLYSNDGKLYAFYGATYQGDQPATSSNGNAAGIRKDILDELGLEIPETIEDFYNCAKAMKAAYPDIYPLILHEEWQPPENLLFAANHTSGDRYYNGTEYVYGPTEDAYKEALMELNKWYTEGLISPDYFTHTSENGTAAVAAGEALMIPSIWEGYPGQWKETYPDQEWILVPAIKNEKYGDPWSFYRGNPSEWNVISSYSVVVGADSKVKDEMLQLMDVQYADEMVNLICWGIEGTTYEIDENGEQHFLPDFLADTTKWPEIAFGQGSCRAGIFPTQQSTIANNESAVYGEIYYNGEIHENERYVDFVSAAYKEELAVPTSLITATALTTDESEEYANIMTPVETFAKEQKVKFIKGERSFDEWDQYLEELNAMGDIQAAMDLYNSNVVE